MNTFRGKTERDIEIIVNAMSDIWYKEGSYANQLFRIIAKSYFINPPREAFKNGGITVDITVKGVGFDVTYVDETKGKWIFNEAHDPGLTDLCVWCGHVCDAINDLAENRGNLCVITDVMINGASIYHEDVKEVNVDNMDDQIRKITKRLDSVESMIAKLNEALNSFEERLIESVNRTLENNENASKNGYTTSIAPGIVRRIVK